MNATRGAWRLVPLLALGLPLAATAETALYRFQTRITTLWDVEGTTSAQTAFQVGDRATVWIVYETSATGTAAPSIHAMSEALVVFDNGFTAKVVGGEIYVNDGYGPGYNDEVWIFGDNHYLADILAPRVGDATLQYVTVELVDSTRTALSSPALLPLPPFSAFDYASARFAFLNDDWTGVTQVFADVTAMSGGVQSAHACSGFVAAKNDGADAGRMRKISASLRDANGNELAPGDLSSAPVIRVTYFPEQSLDPIDVTDRVAGPRPEGAQFSWRDGQWIYHLKGQALSEPGTYFVSMASPDIRQYLVSPDCRTTITVAAH